MTLSENYRVKLWWSCSVIGYDLSVIAGAVILLHKIALGWFICMKRRVERFNGVSYVKQLFLFPYRTELNGLRTNETRIFTQPKKFPDNFLDSHNLKLMNSIQKLTPKIHPIIHRGKTIELPTVSLLRYTYQKIKCKLLLYSAFFSLI